MANTVDSDQTAPSGSTPFESPHDKTNKMTVRPTKTDQPRHVPSLITVFTVCMKKAWVLSYPLSASEDSDQTGQMPGWSEFLLSAQSFCCCTCFSMGDLSVQVSIRFFVHPSVCPSVNIYPGCLVSATLTVLYQSFWNFAGVFIMVWGCACGLDIIVRLFFVTFSTLWT